MSTNITSGVVLIEQPGPSDVLKYQTVTLDAPGPTEVLIHQKAIGVNFVDAFYRNGTFPMPAYPAPIGLEAVGVIAEIGAAVKTLAVGDRVGYYGATGTYAEQKVMQENEVFKLPDDITFEQAASVMVKGLTVHMLVKDSHVVKAGEVVLIHAMMGGVGSLLSAWVRSLGATVIGTVGSAGKKQLALELGYEHVIDLGSEDFGAAVKAITQGKGVDVVYESIGKATFQTSLKLIKKGGSMVLYGWASGMPEIDMADLEQRKIRFVSAVLNHYPAYQDKSGKGMMEVFEQVRNGVFDLKPPAVYDLKEAAKAHADLESRKTTGSIILKGIL